MTKKDKLVWRLGKLPTVSELTELVTKSILTKEEAREILLNKESIEDRDIDSFKSEIKFLRELVEKLSKSRSEITTIIKEIELPRYKRYGWYDPYVLWCSIGSDVTTYANNASYTLTTGTNGSFVGEKNTSFTNISTF